MGGHPPLTSLMLSRAFASGVFLLISVALASAQEGGISKRLGLGRSGRLSNDKIVSGLKQALQVGTANAVKSTGRIDGTFRNQAIKILMPEQLRTVEKGLRAVGYGP